MQLWLEKDPVGGSLRGTSSARMFLGLEWQEQEHHPKSPVGLAAISYLNFEAFLYLTSSHHKRYQRRSVLPLNRKLRRYTPLLIAGKA